MTDFLFRYRNIVPNLSFMFVNHTRKRHMKINYFTGLIKKKDKRTQPYLLLLFSFKRNLPKDTHGRTSWADMKGLSETYWTENSERAVEGWVVRLHKTQRSRFRDARCAFWKCLAGDRKEHSAALQQGEALADSLEGQACLLDGWTGQATDVRGRAARGWLRSRIQAADRTEPCGQTARGPLKKSKIIKGLLSWSFLVLLLNIFLEKNQAVLLWKS